jgi:hypothetical protein
VQACETHSINAAKGHKNDQKLQDKRGIALVDSIFGRDRQLENTEKLMAAMRLWNSKFDTDCEDTLRKTSAYKVIEVSSLEN